jgi:LuxR family maltose regulon positive regulatory protein
MEFFATSLILTKIRPPVSRSRTIQRTRLLQKLSLETGTDLVLVCAPAGYGKTTLLVEWVQHLRQAGTPVAWYALDENDNSPISFGSYLVASLEQALGPGSGLEPVSQVLRASPEVDLPKLLPMVINTICSINRDIVLALDDYHLIRTPVIHQAVEFLISHRPENLHLAMGSRSNPPLPLARWRARGHLIELRASDLRFTVEETGRFLRDSLQLDLSTELSSRLAEQVEGWPAGLQLAALCMPGRSAQEHLVFTFTGGHRRLAEYLLDEVVNQLPEAVQSFLLYSSILARMSAPVCDAILGMDNSADLLKQLEQSNLFVIALDEEGTWYRYHHLFRDFLQTWLNRTQPEQASALHRSACSWFAAHGSLREAAYHAFRCGDWSFAADFVEQYSFTLIIQSEIATIYEWCSALPETVLRIRPKLCIFQSLALAYRFQGKHRSRVEARLQQASQAMSALENLDQALEISELAAVVHTFLAMIPEPGVDAHKQLDLAEFGLTSYSPGDPGRFPWLLIAGYAYLALNRPVEAKNALEEALPLASHSGLFFGTVEALFHLARLAHSQGRLADSLRICRQGQEEFAAISSQYGIVLPALGCLEVAAGCVLLEQDHLDEADQYLRQGLDRMGWGMNPYYLMTAYLAQFSLYESQGRLEEAIACLDQLDSLWPDIQLITQGYRAQAKLRSRPGDNEVVESAKEWLQFYRFSVGDVLPLSGLGPIGAAEAYFQANLIWSRLQIALGQPQAVQPYLDQQLQLAQEIGLPGREIELTLIQAQMFHKQGNQEQALAALEKAFAISRRSGYVRVFDQSAVLDDLIHLAAKKEVCPADIDRILATIRSTRSREAVTILSATSVGKVHKSMQVGELVEPLSERELDVLRLIASGATNQDIVERFVITVGTVKSHIHHIFGKLNARNRTEAVAQARKRGLIETD